MKVHRSKPTTWLAFLTSGYAESIVPDWLETSFDPITLNRLKSNPDLLLRAFSISEFPGYYWETLVIFSALRIEQRLMSFEILHYLLMADRVPVRVEPQYQEWCQRISKSVRPDLWFTPYQENANAFLYLRILQHHKVSYWSRMKLLLPKYIVVKMEESDWQALPESIVSKIISVWEMIVLKLYENKRHLI